jgi:hypothetical protein
MKITSTFRATLATLIVTAASTASLASTSADMSSANARSHGLMDRRIPISWTCRATATDGSGIFFLGIGRTQAEAYTKALETCNRQRRSCIITCDPNM